jgi:bifunctional N-acetylglucosamine-1-phosphate-uridyltransferase/glucosamine-1-phosphate-acetyltransferase GlmU-like protein
MTRWTGVVLAHKEPGSDEMGSRLSTYLHPVAGRPLIWHTLAALASIDSPPERILVLAGPEISSDLFEDVPAEVEVVPLVEGNHEAAFPALELDSDVQIMVVDAAAPALGSVFQELTAQPAGAWVEGAEGEAAAAWLDNGRTRELFRQVEPLCAPSGVLSPQQCIPGPEDALVVRNRAQLAAATAQVRARLVRSLMDGGVTFLLPETVLVDVDVRIGRDTLIYPGVVLEGQTSIGEETVIGPGCRIIDSWIGSGVELKGWNFISHTSVRNRAILEPYVRRGYD